MSPTPKKRKEVHLWTDIALRYIGPQHIVRKIQSFIQECPQGKILWLRGPPGIGKAVAVKTAVSNCKRVLKEFSAVECVKYSFVDSGVIPCLTNYRLGSSKFPVVLIRGIDVWNTLGAASSNGATKAGGVRLLHELFDRHHHKGKRAKKRRKGKKQRPPMRHGPLIVTDHNHYQKDGSEKFKPFAQIVYVNPPPERDLRTITQKLQVRLPNNRPPLPPFYSFTGDVRSFLNHWQMGVKPPLRNRGDRKTRVQLHQDFFPFMKYVATKKWKPFSQTDTISGKISESLPRAVFANWPQWQGHSSLSEVLSDMDLLCPHSGGGPVGDAYQMGGSISGQDWSHWLLAHCGTHLHESMRRKSLRDVKITFPRYQNPAKQSRPAIDMCRDDPAMYGLKAWEIAERLSLVPEDTSSARQPGEVDQKQLVLATRFGFKDFDRDTERKQIVAKRLRNGRVDEWLAPLQKKHTGHSRVRGVLSARGRQLQGSGSVSHPGGEPGGPGHQNRRPA